MLACVILNYNDYESVVSLYEEIKEYKCFEFIILVDNKSTDDSFVHLKALENESTIVIQSDKNGGYGYGNNYGIRYAESLGAEYVLICNPDVSFSEQAVNSTLEVLKNNEKCVASAPKVNVGNPAIKLAKPLKDICFSSLFLNRLFAPRSYKKNFFDGKKQVVVDAIPGSFTIFDVKKFCECGLYDENIFLYHEEVVIARKFKKKGFIQILNLQDKFIHNHSVSVNKSIKSAIKLKRIIMTSQYYYLKTYCGASSFALLIQRFIRPFCYVELFIWKKIRSILKVQF